MADVICFGDFCRSSQNSNEDKFNASLKNKKIQYEDKNKVVRIALYSSEHLRFNFESSIHFNSTQFP